MPKRNDLKTILIIGAGPIVIGQACEFDYSGAQACKALREEGYRVVLVNSNPATIMTDPEMADAVYIEPINWQTVEKIIAKEKPDALLPTMGGQTALNCALDLADTGVLEKYGVELIGAKRDAIRMAEEGASVAVLDILDAEGLELIESLRARGLPAAWWHCDVSSEREVQTVMQDIVEHFGRIIFHIDSHFTFVLAKCC